MSNLSWLKNNDYLEKKQKREFSIAAWVCWGIALILLLIPVRSSFLRIYHINAAQDTPTLSGQVLLLERKPSRQELLYETRIEITYKGKAYTVTEAGFRFTDGMYEQAMESGTVPVYLNPKAPEKSVLSKGIPPRNYILPSLFALIALTLICTGSYCLKRSR